MAQSNSPMAKVGAEILMSELNDSFCRSVAVPTMTSFLYRTALLIHLLLTSTGITFTLFSIKYLREKIYFHRNIKILLCSMMVFANVLSLEMFVMQFRHLVLSFTYNEPCDLFTSASDCFPFFAVNCMALACMTGSQVCITIERIAATVMMKRYSTVSKKFGYSLVAANIFLFGLLMWYSYWGMNEDEAFMSCITIPKSAAVMSNINFALLIILNIFVIISSFGIYYGNKWYGKRFGFQLADRYQMEENLTTSKYMISIVLVQFVVFTFYGSATLFLRWYKDRMNEVTHRILIQFVYLPPYFSFILPIMLCYIVKKGVERRTKQITTMVGRTHIGEVARDNYFEELLKQWG